MDTQQRVAFIEKHMQGKRHIVITGNRGSGKTTLLKAMLRGFGKGETIPGIVTWSEPGKAVYMRQLGCDDVITIGRFNPDSTTRESRMQPVQDEFDVHGVEMLESLLKKDSLWVSIDEIGYLEASSEKYLEKMDAVFAKKRVIAVVRKQEAAHILQILNREDALVVDLDRM